MEAAAQRDEAGNDKFFEEFEILGSCGTKEEDIYGGMYEMPGQGFRTVPPPPPPGQTGSSGSWATCWKIGISCVGVALYWHWVAWIGSLLGLAWFMTCVGLLWGLACTPKLLLCCQASHTPNEIPSQPSQNPIQAHHQQCNPNNPTPSPTQFICCV
jgi:hypothetical protein